MIRELGLTERVVVTGNVKAIEPYYHLADVLVLPSAHEGFGAPLVEAMAAGVPVVAANAGAMPWVIGAETASPAGLLFESGSAPSLAEAMLSVLSDDHTAELLRTRGKERAASFGPERFCQAVSELIEQVEKSARRRKPGGEPHRSARDRADVALRGYRVTSHVPVFGRAIEWIRTNMTSHIKEAYIDRIVERQVMYNLALANEIDALSTQLEQQAERIGELESRIAAISRLPEQSRDDALHENVSGDPDADSVERNDHRA